MMVVLSVVDFFGVSGEWVFLFFMKLRILSWNVRGINNPQKRDRVKFWLRQWQCNIVCLQETKLDTLDQRVIRSVWSNPYVDWEMLDVVGTVGGVLLMWD